MPSEFENEDPNLLARIVQLRTFAATRDAMKSDKSREADTKWVTTKSPMAKIVAKVQFMNQHGLEPEDMEEDEIG